MKTKQQKFNNRFFYAAASIILAAVIAFIAIPTVSSRTNGKTEIVQVSEVISRGEVIDETKVVLAEIGAYNLPGNTLKNLEDVIGKYASIDLVPGDLILSSKVSNEPISSDLSLSQIPSGKLAYSITVKTLASGLSDKLQKNDIIRLYHYKEQAQEFYELQFVKVLAVTDAEGLELDNAKELSEDEEKKQTATLTLLVSPEQALLLTRLENDGVLQAALISRGNEQLAEKLLLQQDKDIKDAQEQANGEAPKLSQAGNETDPSNENSEEQKEEG